MKKKFILGIIGGIIVIFIIIVFISILFYNEEDHMLNSPAFEEKGTPERIHEKEDIDKQTAVDINSQEESSKKIIKTGNLDIMVKEIKEAVNKITDIVAKKDGFVANSNIYTRKDKTKYGSIIIRVSTKYFEQTINEIKDIAKTVKQESLSGQDVTEEFVDLQARLKNLELKEEQYQKILNRAIKIEDVLKASEYLFNTRKEVERLKGRIKYLENLTDLATIRISLSEETKIEIPTNEWKPFAIIKDALRSTIRFWQGIASILIWMIFLLVPLAIVVWIVVKIVKVFKKKKTKKEESKT